MKSTLPALAVAGASLFAAPAQCAPPSTHQDALAARLDRAIDRALAERRIVGTVVLVERDGKLLYKRAAGLADREHGTPMSEDALFLLSSVTKPIVTVAALSMVEQGVLSLDDPVTRWLPDFKPRLLDASTPRITVRQLLTHTAGLSYRFFEGAQSPYNTLDVSDGMDQPGLSMEENLRRIAAAPLAYRPGEGWRYSVALDVLGALLQKAAGEPLPQIVREGVTGPLGMNDTDFVVKERRRLVTHYVNAESAPRPMRAADAVDFNGAAIRFAPMRIADPASFPSGGAGMAGSAPDIMRLLSSLVNGGGPLRQATAADMMRAHVGASAQTMGPGWGFGYGGAVLVDPAAVGVKLPAGVFQWGGVYGHSWLVDPGSRLVLVVLTNTSIEGMAGTFPADLRAALYGED